MGLALGAVVVVGVVLSVLDTPLADLRRRYAATAGLAFGALAFAVTTAYGRSGIELFGSRGEPRASRYVYVLAALLLPLIAACAWEIARRWRPLVIVAVALFLVGVPGNVRAFRPTGVERFTLGNPELILALAQAPQAKHARRDLEPLPFSANGMTVGWLLDARAAGRLPEARHIAPSVEDYVALLLSLDQGHGAPARTCRPVAADVTVRLDSGDEVVLPDGFSTVRRIERGREHGAASYLVTQDLGHILRVETGPLDVRIETAPGSAAARVCD